MIEIGRCVGDGRRSVRFPTKPKKRRGNTEPLARFWLSRAPCAWIPVARHRHSYFLGSSSLLRTSYIVSVRHSNFCLPPQKKVVFQVASSCSNFAHGSLSCTYDLAFAIVAQQHARTNISQITSVKIRLLMKATSTTICPPPSLILLLLLPPAEIPSTENPYPRPTTVSGVSLVVVWGQHYFIESLHRGQKPERVLFWNHIRTQRNPRVIWSFSS